MRREWTLQPGSNEDSPRSGGVRRVASMGSSPVPAHLGERFGVISTSDGDAPDSGAVIGWKGTPPRTEVPSITVTTPHNH